jgi:hypothetical protein
MFVRLDAAGVQPRRLCALDISDTIYAGSPERPGQGWNMTVCPTSLLTASMIWSTETPVSERLNIPQPSARLKPLSATVQNARVVKEYPSIAAL